MSACVRLHGFAGLLVLLAVLGGCATGGGRPLAPASGPDQLRVAKLRYDQHQYADAVELLKGYLQFQSGAPDLDEAHFLLGMCYVKRQEWPLAATEFQLLVSEFTDSRRLADAHYWLGISYWKQTRGAPYDQDMTKRSIGQFDRLLSLFPEHPQATEVKGLKVKARDRLAEKGFRNGALYLKLHFFSPARYYFDLVRKDYPESAWAERALSGEAEALSGLDRVPEARQLLQSNVAKLTDGEARRRADQLVRKFGPGPVSVPDSVGAVAPPDSAGAPG